MTQTPQISFLSCGQPLQFPAEVPAHMESFASMTENRLWNCYCGLEVLIRDMAKVRMVDSTSSSIFFLRSLYVYSRSPKMLCAEILIFLPQLPLCARPTWSGSNPTDVLYHRMSRRGRFLPQRKISSPFLCHEIDFETMKEVLDKPPRGKAQLSPSSGRQLQGDSPLGIRPWWI